MTYTKAPLNIRPLLESDWDAVATIYKQGIETGMATFETSVPSFQDWINARVPNSAIVLEENGTIMGWAALSPYSSRCVYEGVAEVSIYMHDQAKGKGFGQKLLQQLIDLSEKMGIWTLQAGIFPENEASLHVHHKLGFRTVGTSEKLGQMNGVWRDVVHLERRSSKIQ